MTAGPGISTPTHLTVTVSGDTTGLTYSLSTSSLPADDGATAYATLSLTHTSNAGSGNVNLAITGSNGSYPTATAGVVVERQGLTAQGVYVTQGPQFDTGDLVPSSSGGSYSGVQLVAGKKTVVRLYADATGTPAGTPDVVAQLYGYANGHPLPGSPLEPDYGPLSTSGHPLSTLPEVAGASAINEQVSDSELESNANAYTFTLPYSWTESGLEGGYWPEGTNIKLVGQVQQYLASTASASCQNRESFTLTSIPFTEVGFNYSDIEVFPFALTVNGKSLPSSSEVFQDTGAVTPLPDNGGLVVYPYISSIDITQIANNSWSCSGFGNYCANLRQPCQTLSTDPSVVAVFSGDPLNNSTPESAVNACSNVKDWLTLQIFTNFEQNWDDGAVDLDHDVGVNEGVARGLTNSIPGQYSVVDGTPGYRPLTSVAHEMFHEFGLPHASAACGGNGPSWPPDQEGELDGIAVDVLSEPYKFIANNSPDFNLSNPLQGCASCPPNAAYDLMSYCAHIGGGDPNDWVSPRNWENLIGIFGTGDPPGDKASAARAAARRASPLAPLAQVDPAELDVTGFVSQAGVQIMSVGPQVGRAPSLGTSADTFTLTALGSHGQKLVSVPMSASSGHVDGPTGELPFSTVSAEVPSSDVDSVEIAHNGTVMATRVRPARQPRVQVLAPRRGAVVGRQRAVLVRWRATNPEHLPLTATIDYSTNGGGSWRTVYLAPNDGHASLPSFYFTASRSARIRVRVSDGFNETSAVSGVFRALGAPPVVKILTELTRGAQIPGDATVQLSGQAIDQAAQILGGRSLRWFDGPFALGTGTAINAGPLPVGVNHVRLVARDPAGRTSSATLTVRVTSFSISFLTLKVPGRVDRHARVVKIKATSLIPATLRIGKQRFTVDKPTKKERPIALKIRSGRTPLLLHLEVTADGITTPFAFEIQR